MACIFLIGCADKNDRTEEMIKKNLPPGTSAAAVESFLKKMHCGFSYDKEAKRYTAVMHNTGPRDIVSKKRLITVKMDENDKVKTADFLVYYKDIDSNR